MNKIPLRIYIKEIEEAIDEKQVEEAIAHCRHILKSFPKHIDTYRLLGKAYLESQRYVNAADIFQRVISSIPNDFISNIGMSIIREDESNLNAAIWHMERAFESQPYNTAIQGELRRLYGLRDGMEPPKIRMTKGALAQMYAKSDLFDQAIAEIRSSLATDPNRADLLVVLAKMYAKNGQETEAIEVCGSLLHRFPYCLEANLLLSDLLPEDESEEELRTYRQRIIAIDPYYAFTTTQSPTVDLVQDQAVTIARLDWVGGLIDSDSSQEIEWLTRTDTKQHAADVEEDELPEWLNVPTRTSDAKEPDEEISEPKRDIDIPEWMDKAGWKPSTGELDESSIKVSYEVDDEVVDSSEAIAGEIPDWLQNIAPEGGFEESEDETEPKITGIVDDLPEWLNGIDGIGATDWLNDGKTPSAAEDIGQKQEPEIESGREELESPDWLEKLGDEIPEPKGEIEGDDIPDWLTGFVEESVEEEIQKELIRPSDDSPAELDSEWLQTISPDLKSEEDNVTEIEGLEPQVGEEDEIPDWIQDLEGEVVEAESDDISDTSDVSEWLERMATGTLDPNRIAESEIDFSQEQISDEVVQEESSDTPSWLRNLEEEGSEPEMVLDAQDVPTTAEPPEWLQAMVDDGPEPKKEFEVVYDSEPADLPDWLLEPDEEYEEDASPPDRAIPSIEESPEEKLMETMHAAAPDPLEVMAEVVGDKFSESEMESLPQIEDEDDEIDISTPGEMPDWLKELKDEVPSFEEEDKFEEISAPSVGEEAVPAEIPDWMQELGGVDQILDSASEIEEPIDQPLGDFELASGFPEGMTELEDELATPEEIEVPIEEVLSEIEVETVSEELPDWMAELREETKIDEEVQPTPEDMAVPADVPDWIQELREELPEVEVKVEPEDVSLAGIEEEAEPAVIPDWMQELEVEEPETIPTAETEAVDADLPDWMAEIIAAESESIGSADFEEVEEPDSYEEAVSAEIPDWLSELRGEEPEPIDAPEMDAPGLYEPEQETASEVPEWLSGLGKDQSRMMDGPEEGLPDERIEPSQEASQPLSDGIEIPDWVGDSESSRFEQYPSGVTGWLEDIDEEEISKLEIDYTTGELPSWLENIGSSTPDQDKVIFPDEFETEPVDAIPLPEKFEEEKADIDVDGEDTVEYSDLNEAMAWLESLAAKKGTPEEELITSPEERPDTPPDWIQDLASEKEQASEVDAPIIEPEFDEKIAYQVQEELSSESVNVEDPEALFGEIPDSGDLSEDPRTADLEAGISWLDSLTESDSVPDPDSKPIDGKPIEYDDLDGFEEFASDRQTSPLSGVEYEILNVEKPTDSREILETEPTTDEMDRQTTTPDEIEGPEKDAVESVVPDWVLERMEPVPETPLDDIVVEADDEFHETEEMEEEIPDSIIKDREEQASILPDWVSDEEEIEEPTYQWKSAEPVDSMVETKDPQDEIPVKPDFDLPLKPIPEKKVTSDEFENLRFAAQDDFTKGDSEAGLMKYENLIKKGKHLDSLIYDLDQVVNRDVPIETHIEILQILGDAYMKNDDIQSALDTYTRAEELLR